jgi:FkbM family methyltransferase
VSLGFKLSKFLAMPARFKYLALAQRFRLLFPRLPILIRLQFGAWWLVENSALDFNLSTIGFENAEMRFVGRFLQLGMIVLDVGAHHGVYTLLASKRVGRNGKVFAFEPSPRERRRLVRHVLFNSCSNVRVEPYALGSSRTQADLFLSPGINDWCNSLRPPITESTASPLKVTVARLDDWMEENEIERVDFIKMDVEGGERDVLRGAEKMLGREPRPVFLAEVQDLRTGPWGYAAKEIIEHLAQRGYKWFAIDAEGWLRELDAGAEKYDGNFVACPEERLTEIGRFVEKRDLS